MTLNVPLLLAGGDDQVFLRHRAAATHPERPERLIAALKGVLSVAPHITRIDAPEADDADLLRCHDRGYLDFLRQRLADGQGYLDPDTFYNEATREAAWRASGGAVALVTALRARSATAAIGLFRPPGHHARPMSAMGFCVLNHISVAARAAMAAGAHRVAIVDWDVHHGNGTQEIFFDDPNVLFISLHQFPHYPGTGSPTEVGHGPGIGTTINVAMPAGAGPAAYGEAFRRVVLPEVRRFDAELLLVSAGFDAHRRDPLGGLELDDETFGAMTGALLSLGAPLALFLEGGYDLEAIEASMSSVTRALLGSAPRLSNASVAPAEERAITATEAALAQARRR